MRDENTENRTPEVPESETRAPDGEGGRAKAEAAPRSETAEKPEAEAHEAHEMPVPVEPTPEERIAALEREKKELYDRLLRTAADFDNFRKRSRKDLEDARHATREEVLKEMLQVVDNLERALAATQQPGAGAEGIVEGVKLVLRQFQAVLERFGVKAFESVGQPFDPARHDAISQIETTEHPPGTVAGEMVKGYMMGGRLLRPALVAVAKAPAAPAPPPAQDAGPPADEAKGGGETKEGSPVPASPEADRQSVS